MTECLAMENFVAIEKGHDQKFGNGKICKD